MASPKRSTTIKALVTGASGFIGSHVARCLKNHGFDVRCMTRNAKDPHQLRQHDIEFVDGDLLDRSSLKKALLNQEVLFHVAALYRLWNPNPQEIYTINVQGTKVLFEEAMQAGIQKIIYTSTVGTIGIPSDGSSGNEQTPFNLKQLSGHYKISKYQAELEVFKLIQQGLPIIIVNPSAPMGPGDVKPTPTGKIIVDFLNRKMPAYVDTGLNIVDVRDVAQGHLLAFQKGKIGERYILGHQNLTLKQILDHLSVITGLHAPKFKIPYFILPPLSYINATTAKLFNYEPQLCPEAVKMASKKMFFNSDKAMNELGFKPRPVNDTFHDAIEWFQQNGYIKK